MAINQTVGAMRGPRWLLGFSRLPDKPHFYLIMPFLASGLISQSRKMVKTCFPQSPVIRAPTLLDRSYRQSQKLHELLGEDCFH